MGLANILADVEADLVAQLTAIASPLASVSFAFGKRATRNLKVPPRITWVRLPGLFGPSVQGTGRNPRTTGRILRTHSARVEAHIWADPSSTNDDSDAELLLHQLVASVYRTTHGSFEVLGDDWPPPDNATQGFLCVVAFTFQIPVPDAPPTFRGGPNAFPFDESSAPPAGVLQAPGDS